MNEILKLAGVYKITCLANSKFYIGSTKMFKQRWKEHRWQLKAGKSRIKSGMSVMQAITTPVRKKNNKHV